MEKVKFIALLPLITADVADKIMSKYKFDEDKAISEFSKSQLYALLENEETKIWQYSTEMLLDLYNRELSGNLILPEV